MTDSFFDRLCSSLRPEKITHPDQVEPLLDSFEEWVISQPSHEKASLRVRSKGESLEIAGYLPYPSTCKALSRILAMTSLPPVELRVTAMDQHREDPCFLQCRTRIRGWSLPKEGSECAHIWEPEDPIRVFRNDRGFSLCQADDGYLAWVLPDDLKETLRNPVMADTRVDLHRTEFLDWSRILQKWKGVPYAWGGTGEKGIDCSGFVMRLYQQAGYQIPRDSRQQMLIGSWVGIGASFDSIRNGDLLFFTHDDGRIGHVGVSLGESRVLHAQEGGVCTFSLDPSDREYDPYRAAHCVFAKRLLRTG